MKLNNRILHLLSAIAVATIIGVTAVKAGETDKLIIDDKVPIASWTFCDIFDKHYLYEGEGFIKSIRPVGRYQGQWISQQEDVNNTLNNGYHKYQHRRVRVGFEIKMANDLKFYVESNIADNHQLTRDRFINDHQDFYIQWEPSDDFLVRVGKQKQHITREDITSSKRIKTVERSAIVNEMAGARPWGAVAELQTGKLRHEIGAWLYGGHRADPNWVDFQSHGGASYNVTYDLCDDIDLHFDYVFADNNSGNTSSRGPAAVGYGPNYEHAFALGADIECGKFGVITDFIYAANRTGSGTIPAGNDTWGYYVLPSYDLTDNLQAVFRYGYMAEGSEQRTQRFPVRQNVENYHSIYTGLQYFICEDKFKIMGGYEYATGDIIGTNNEISDGSWQLAIRTYF